MNVVANAWINNLDFEFIIWERISKLLRIVNLEGGLMRTQRIDVFLRIFNPNAQRREEWRSIVSFRKVNALNKISVLILALPLKVFYFDLSTTLQLIIFNESKKQSILKLRFEKLQMLEWFDCWLFFNYEFRQKSDCKWIIRKHFEWMYIFLLQWNHLLHVFKL